MEDYRPSWNIDSIPEQLILSRAAKIISMRAGPRGGKREGSGRPPKLYPCEKCGAEVRRKDLATHRC